MVFVVSVAKIQVGFPQNHAIGQVYPICGVLPVLPCAENDLSRTLRE